MYVAVHTQSFKIWLLLYTVQRLKYYCKLIQGLHFVNYVLQSYNSCQEFQKCVKLLVPVAQYCNPGIEGL